MKRIMIVAGIFSLICFVPAIDSFAQQGVAGKGSGGWGMNSQYERMYDPRTVEIIRGEVERVDMITPLKGMSRGVHLLVRTDKETISVHLGPEWYLENQDVKIVPKDQVEINGSRVIFNGKPALIAGEIKKGDEVLKLRDGNGYPAWSGWRRR
jgi:hypothetical protein